MVRSRVLARDVAQVLADLRISRNPREMRLAIDPWTRTLAQEAPPLRIVRFSGEALTHGVEAHEVEAAMSPRGAARAARCTGFESRPTVRSGHPG